MSKRVRAKKSLGQNFLVDPNYQRKIIAALDPQPVDDVLEIGPGTGALTQHLVGHVRRITVIELDDGLAAALEERYASREDFTIVHRDVLTVDLRQIPASKVLGNIPYNITSPLIFKLLEPAVRDAPILIMIQKEVADRLVAKAGTPEYGALTVGVQSVAQADRLFTVPRGAFRPVPSVDSAVVRLAPFRPRHMSDEEEADLRVLTRAAFSWRRKQLQNILRHAEPYRLPLDQLQQIETQTGITMSDRPEQLGPPLFIALTRALRARGYPQPETRP